MSAVDELLRDIPIPRMLKAVQRFARPVVDDVGGILTKKLRGPLGAIRPGWSVAITAGSRGISNMPLVLRTVAREVRAAGGEPFLFPAMGSHGGATAEGQAHMLKGLGVTEESVGAPIRSTMETVRLGTAANGSPVYLDRYADEADAIIVVNRIKPHTSFRGPYESGIMKMIAIGMGKQKGADFAHRMGFGHMAENVPAIARVVLEKKNVLCAVGLLENAYHETAQVEVMAPGEVEEREPLLLRHVWEQLYPRLLFDSLDVLILDELGKDISGTGFDTNILGRYHTPYASGGPEIARIAVLDVTEKSHGNVNGVGMLDFTTRRLFDKMDFDQTYPNSLTSTVPLSVKLPMVLKNDRQAIQAAIKTCGVPDRARVRMARIRNTMELEEIEISESLRAQADERPGLEVRGAPFDLRFDGAGNLF